MSPPRPRKALQRTKPNRSDRMVRPRYQQSAGCLCPASSPVFLPMVCCPRSRRRQRQASCHPAKPGFFCQRRTAMDQDVVDRVGAAAAKQQRCAHRKIAGRHGPFVNAGRALPAEHRHQQHGGALPMDLRDLFEHPIRWNDSEFSFRTLDARWNHRSPFSDLCSPI